MWHDALLVAGKDLRIEMRSKVALNQVLPFAVVTVVLFGLALGPDRRSLSAAAAGLFWVAVLMSAVLSVQRSFAIESAGAARDGLRLSGLDPGGIFVGKAIAIAIELVVLEVVLSIVVALLYQVSLTGGFALAGACLGASLGLSAVGTLYGALSSGSRVKETLLPLLFFPVVAPVLIAATKVWQEALAHHATSGLSWLGILWIFALCYGAIGTVVFGSLLEDQ
jgi:heme exporter protein B